MIITSLQNKLIKYYASLKLKKNRDNEKLFLIENEDVLKEALDANLVKTILYIKDKPFDNENVEYIEVTEEIIKKLSSQTTPGKFIAVCYFLKENKSVGKKVIVLDGVQDPGNVGTILRSALAFGFDEMLLSNDSIDIYNDKFIRASKGSIFHMNIKRLDIQNELLNRKACGYQIISTSLDDKSVNYDHASYQDKLCLIVGNEGQGISKEIFALSTLKVYIPMSEMMESLNVGVAASIVMSKIYNK